MYYHIWLPKSVLETAESDFLICFYVFGNTPVHVLPIIYVKTQLNLSLQISSRKSRKMVLNMINDGRNFRIVRLIFI